MPMKRLAAVAICVGCAMSTTGFRATGVEAAGATQEIRGLVESAAPRWSASEGWRVEQEPAVIIGNDVGPEPYLLYGVETALLLPGGGVMVVSWGTHDLRYFSADGEHLRTVGGRGQGPGEF
jgi:hypothetical protein